MRGRWAVERGDHREAATLAERGLEADPDATGLRRLWLYAAIELGDWAAATSRP